MTYIGFLIGAYQLENMKSFIGGIFVLIVSVCGVWAETPPTDTPPTETPQLDVDSLIYPPDWLKEYTSVRSSNQKITSLHFLDVAWRSLQSNPVVASDPKLFAKAKSNFVPLLLNFLDNSSTPVRLEAIHVLKQLNNPPKEMWRKIAEIALSDSAFILRTEAFVALDSAEFLDYSVQEYLSSGLQNQLLAFRKKTYRILSKQEYLSPSVEQKLKQAFEKEKYLKTKSFSEIEHYYQKAQGNKSLQMFLSRIQDFDRSSMEVSEFLGNTLQKKLSHDDLLKTIQTVRELKMFDSNTIDPMLSMLPHVEEEIQKEIIRALIQTRSIWDFSIFNRITNVLFYLHYRSQLETYYLLEKLLWSNPKVQKSMETILYSNQPLHSDLRNLVFSPHSRYRLAGLWFLSEIPSLSKEDFKQKLLHFFSGYSLFKQAMSFFGLPYLFSINQDIEIQKTLIHQIKHNHSPMVRTFIIHCFKNLKITDFSIIKDIFRVLHSDISASVRSNATYALGLINWGHDSLSLDLKNQFIEYLIKIVKTQLAIDRITYQKQSQKQKTANKNISMHVTMNEVKAAIWVLGQIRPQELVAHQVLTGFLKSSSRENQRLAYRALQKIGPSDPLVLQQMKQIESYMENWLPVAKVEKEQNLTEEELLTETHTETHKDIDIETNIKNPKESQKTATSSCKKTFEK